jgi:hypothetical protein
MDQPTQIVINPPVPMEIARQEKWTVYRGPNAGAQGTMGELLDTNRMDIVDLAYVIRGGQYPSKKAAAITLLAHELGQPQTVQSAMRYGPTVLGDNNYLEEQQYDSMLRAFVFGFVPPFVAATILLVLAQSAGRRYLQGEPWLLTDTISVLSTLIFTMATLWYARRKWNQNIELFRSFRDGREGEEWVTDTVRAALDNRWTVFRGVRLPGRKADIDLVLVGPAGVWALETKAYKAPVRVHDNKWEYFRGSTWHALDGDPVAQVRKNAVQLRSYLEQYGIRTYVNAVVVLTKPQEVSNFGPTGEPIWLHFDVENQLARVNKLPATLTDEAKEKAIAALSKVLDSGGNNAG